MITTNHVIKKQERSKNDSVSGLDNWMMVAPFTEFKNRLKKF